MEIGIKAKLVNHALLEAIYDQGFKSVNDFCRHYDLHSSYIGKMINLKMCPRSKNYCDKLEKILKRPIEMIFPPDLVEQVEKKAQTVFYFHKEVEKLPIYQVNPNQLSYNPIMDKIDENNLKESLNLMLGTLTNREKKVLELRFGLVDKEKSLEEVGEILNCTRERVRQLEAKALRKLRHPAKSKNLKEYLWNK